MPQTETETEAEKRKYNFPLKMSHHSDKPSPASAGSTISGKTARACDSCAVCRARWYCAADDAFLCHPCDALVHSANPLARRHERLRLKSSPLSIYAASAAPSWHHGCKRKARTPRPHHKPVVPELESSADEQMGDDDVGEEQLLYRVPVFDPALSFGSSSPPPVAEPLPQATVAVRVGPEFAPTELELAEFAEDMESLLGRELDGGESFSMEELGLVNERVVEMKGELKEEEDLKGGGLSFELEVDLTKETIDLNFGCGSPEMTVQNATAEARGEVWEEKMMRGIGLRLNYEAVMEAWLASGSSPWISGGRPWLGVEEFWLQCMGMCSGIGAVGIGIQVMNVGREARVTRYREKRRTRLFSKKIRYEVRKLNAEKRPRMKGRFVKRESFTPAPTAAIKGRSSSGGGLAC